MSEIKHILLEPAEGDPHKLLGDPNSAAWKCGARPPTVVKVGDVWLRGWPTIDDDALVLAWDGEPVAGGLDRASRVCGRGPWLAQGFEMVLYYKAKWEAIGTLVLLDAEGREVSDE